MPPWFHGPAPFRLTSGGNQRLSAHVLPRFVAGWSWKTLRLGNVLLEFLIAMKTSFTTALSSQPSRGCGFTLTELAVVIAVVGMLSILCVTAMAGAKGQSKIATCADNIQQLVGASQIYANENKGLLPIFTGGGNWAWDLPDRTVQPLLNIGLEKKNFYCPGTAPRFTDWENFEAPGTNLWDYVPGPNGYHVIGYLLAYAGSNLNSTNLNLTLQPELINFSGTYLAVPNAQRVLAADAVISVRGTLPVDLQPENNSGSIQGGFPIPHLSPHLEGAVPAGGNAGFKDGHVEWRTFNSMVPRNSYVPYFWW